jgi:hypothetical protein
MKANDMIVFSFQSAYPSWESNADGKQFLSNIQKFKKKMQIRLSIREARGI